jgi:hypothetical protein
MERIDTKMKGKGLIWIIVLVALISSVTATNWCYQESANVATSCGGLSTGTYRNGSYTSIQYYAYVNVTYTKPPNVNNNSKWMIKHGVLSSTNISIIKQCWNYSTTTLKFRLLSGSNAGDSSRDESWMQCWDGTGWNTLSHNTNSTESTDNTATKNDNVKDGNWGTWSGVSVFWTNKWISSGRYGGGGRIFEDAMYWSGTYKFYFKNETSKQYIRKNVSVLIYNLDFSYNFSTDKGNKTIFLPSNKIFNVLITSTSFNQKVYQINTSFDNDTTFYLNDYTSVLATVVNEIGNFVEGATVKVYRYEPLTNTYLYVEGIPTNNVGEALLHLKLNTQLYYFVIEYPTGTVVQTTSQGYIYSDTIQFQILTTSPIGSTFYNTQGILHNLTFNNKTNVNKFNFTYIDGNQQGSNYCLVVWKVSTTGNTLIKTNCTTAYSGNLIVNVSHINGTTFLGQSYVVVSGNQIELKSLYYKFKEPNPFNSNANAKAFGLLIALILTFTIIFMTTKYTIAIIALPFPLMILSYMGIFAVPIYSIVGIEVIAIIIAIILNTDR